MKLAALLTAICALAVIAAVIWTERSMRKATRAELRAFLERAGWVLR